MNTYLPNAYLIILFMESFKTDEKRTKSVLAWISCFTKFSYGSQNVSYGPHVYLDQFSMKTALPLEHLIYIYQRIHN